MSVVRQGDGGWHEFNGVWICNWCEIALDAPAEHVCRPGQPATVAARYFVKDEKIVTTGPEGLSSRLRQWVVEECGEDVERGSLHLPDELVPVRIVGELKPLVTK